MDATIEWIMYNLARPLNKYIRYQIPKWAMISLYGFKSLSINKCRTCSTSILPYCLRVVLNLELYLYHYTGNVHMFCLVTMMVAISWYHHQHYHLEPTDSTIPTAKQTQNPRSIQASQYCFIEISTYGPDRV